MDDLARDIRRYSPDTSSLWLQALRNLYSHPAFGAVVFYRLGHWAWVARTSPIPRVLYIAYRIVYPFVRWFSGVELQARTHIGPGLCIMHFGPTVIHPATVMGENVTILPGVVIGAAKGGTPRLGNDIEIGAGVTILGPVNIGSHVCIGAGAVVTHDLPDHCTAVGVPAHPL